jgi:hypothetical protein
MSSSLSPEEAPARVTSLPDFYIAARAALVKLALLTRIPIATALFLSSIAVPGMEEILLAVPS